MPEDDLLRDYLIASGAYYALVATQLFVDLDPTKAREVLASSVQDAETDALHAAVALVNRDGSAGRTRTQDINALVSQRYTP